MDWSSGSELVEKVAQSIVANVPDAAARKRLYLDLVNAAEDQDWDCQQEVEGIDPILDKIVKRR